MPLGKCDTKCKIVQPQKTGLGQATSYPQQTRKTGRLLELPVLLALELPMRTAFASSYFSLLVNQVTHM